MRSISLNLSVATRTPNGLKASLDQVRKIAQAEQQGGNTLIDESGFQKKLAETEIAISAMEFTELRILSQLSAGKNVGSRVVA